MSKKQSPGGQLNEQAFEEVMAEITRYRPVNRAWARSVIVSALRGHEPKAEASQDVWWAYLRALAKTRTA